mgnify:CR=1 FL=1
MVGCRLRGNVKRRAHHRTLSSEFSPSPTSLLSPRRSLSFPTLDSFVSRRGTPVEILSDVNNYPGEPADAAASRSNRARKDQKRAARDVTPRVDFYFNRRSMAIRHEIFRVLRRS